MNERAVLSVPAQAVLGSLFPLLVTCLMPCDLMMLDELQFAWKLLVAGTLAFISLMLFVTTSLIVLAIFVGEVDRCSDCTGNVVDALPYGFLLSIECALP